ncbi:hypothetical protein BofuT4_uP073920.1 [Botrytis cinerea T4]|uniref:Uncharacterized protein n=1 Tax=Botryotinia fuckeliana (strain T4) TaxID=999810 RepID=G2XPH4_BOTF4|nr:hypothetical protein BofuT4_uP073920.1 [Botrytis cinerea T4]
MPRHHPPAPKQKGPDITEMLQTILPRYYFEVSESQETWVGGRVPKPNLAIFSSYNYAPLLRHRRMT